MSLMKTLAKVALGVAVAKGASSMMKKSGSGQGGLGGLLGGLTGQGSTQSGTRHAGSTRSSSGGGLQDMLGGLLGGSGGGSGGLGGMLNQLGARSGSGSGGLAGMLGGLTGAGGLLAGTDEKLRRRPTDNGSDFGTVLNSQFDSTPEPEIEPTQDQEALAALMLSAMIQAAKSDGVFDDAEQEKLLEHLGEMDEDDAAFVNAQLSKPVDVDGLVRQTPDGMENQIYAVSLLAIDLDTRDEAQYLDKLAKGLGIAPEQVNSIHADLGVPSLYT